MATISLDNGYTVRTVDSLGDAELARALEYIEAEIGEMAELRERVHAELAPCTPREFVRRFCEIYLGDSPTAPYALP